jgi:hypothetical protein
MTNSELFTAAHKLAKTFEGNYTACFVLALKTLKETKMETTTEKIKRLKNEVKEAKTPTTEGRQTLARNCKELYNIIEAGLYEKYGEDAINDAYNDLCNGNFAEPFMCEQKKDKFTLYANIYISRIA